MNHLRIWNAMLEDLHRRLGVTVSFKNESRLMRAIGFVMFFNPGFMTHYITTIGTTVYFPKRADVDRAVPPWQTLAHEGIHAGDYKHGRTRFVARYLFPQIMFPLALTAVAAIWLGPWALLSLVMLAAAAPWPSPGRTALERRGYMMTAMCDAIARGEAYVRTAEYQAYLQRHYTGPDYYYMCRDSEAVARFCMLDTEHAIAVAAGKVYDPDYSPVADLIRANA